MPIAVRENPDTPTGNAANRIKLPSLPDDFTHVDANEGFVPHPTATPQAAKRMHGTRTLPESGLPVGPPGGDQFPRRLSGHQSVGPAVGVPPVERRAAEQGPANPLWRHAARLSLWRGDRQNADREDRGAGAMGADRQSVCSRS